MDQKPTVSHGTADVTAEPSSPTYWNHFKTIILIVGVNTMYFSQMTFLVGAGAFSRSIVAVLGGESLVTWPASCIVIMTGTLSLPISQAADYWGRKWFIVVPALIGCIGSVVIASAKSMEIAIAGFVIGGITGGSSPLMHAVASEVLPRKFRSWAQASVQISVALGCIFSLCLGGYLTRSDPAGFRTYWYICAGVFAFSAAATTILYNSVPRQLQVTLTSFQKIRALDWVGYFFLATGVVLFCVGLSWAQNPYSWKDAHVLAPLLIGCSMLLSLVIYSWKIKVDGILHHDLFHDRNFPIALGSVFIEGTSFMAANVFVPYSLSVLYATSMGSFRQALCYNTAYCVFIAASFTAGLYIYVTRSVRVPSIIGFLSFLIFFILLATITATTTEPHFWGYLVFCGIGLGFLLTTLVTAAQFSTPPELIATTSGLMMSARSVGGSIGAAIYNAIFNSGLTSNLFPKVSAAVAPFGLSTDVIEPVIGALSSGNITLAEGLPGVTPDVIAAAGFAMNEAYVVGFRYVFICAGTFSFVALIAVAFLRDPRPEFNSKIDAPIEGVAVIADQESKAVTA